MRAHTTGKAKGRYICPIAGGVHTHGLGRTVQLTEPMRLVFAPGWDDDRYEPDPDRPGWNRAVTYHRDTPGRYEQDKLDRAAGRVFGPGCVISAGYQPPPPGDRWHGRAGVYLVPAAGADPATWFVDSPVTYKKCSACPKRVIAGDKTRMEREWVPARESYWQGSGGRMRQVEISPGPHPAGTYACPDCRPAAASPAPAAPQDGTAPPAVAAAGKRETGDPATPADEQGQDHAYAAIHAAAGRLAGVCDFAESQDGQGFNATDTWLGHVLAAMPASSDQGTADDENSIAAELTWRLTRQGLGKPPADDAPATGTSQEPAGTPHVSGNFQDQVTGTRPIAGQPPVPDLSELPPEPPVPSRESTDIWSLKSMSDYTAAQDRWAAWKLADQAGRLQRADASHYDVMMALAGAENVAPEPERPFHAARLDAYAAAYGLRGWHRGTGRDRDGRDGQPRVYVNQVRTAADRDHGRYYSHRPLSVLGPGHDVIDRDTGQAAAHLATREEADAWIRHAEERTRSVAEADAAPDALIAGISDDAAAMSQKTDAAAPHAEPPNGIQPLAGLPGQGRREYGPRDEITIRHWREAHIDPDKIRAWCRDTGRAEPAGRGELPRDLAEAYLAERGAADIPMPGGPSRAGWLASRPVIEATWTARAGRFTVLYGPCPRCRRLTSAIPVQPLPLCLECAQHRPRGDGGTPPAGTGGPPGQDTPLAGDDDDSEAAEPARHGQGAAQLPGPGSQAKTKRLGSPAAASPAGRCHECQRALPAHEPGCPAEAGREPEVPGTGDDDGDGDGDGDPGPGRGRALRRAAHLYLGHGLLPVPGWAATARGECRCPRGGDCPRPGKHPRSVHTGPGPHDYSWKPLACRTREEVDERFADNGKYASANLMLAIPAGMLVVDQDDDDGGRQAIAALAGQLGELPPTLSHRTPHGVHRVYRTPPGWTGRAWVGKDARNPLPAGIDLRVPGQILMAPPSQVPAPGGLATYGPTAGTGVAGLPAAYLTAWTPPRPQPGRPRRAVPVPPDRADTAASYLHAKVTGIVADLAVHEPGGRNTAIYTAALKVGSAIGAARATPGAEHAAAAWSDEAAEDALMEAAERNGYTAKDGAAGARSAIRSGLRNGLRNPRPLPDFTASPPPVPGSIRPQHEPGNRQQAGMPAQDASATRSRDASPGTGQVSPVQAPSAASRERPAVRSVSAVLRAAGHKASSHDYRAGYGPEGYQVQATPDGAVLVRHVAIADDVNGIAPGTRITQMLAEYGHALRDAGFRVTGRAGTSLTVTPQAAVRQASAPASREQDKQTQASRAAAAASDAYRAGDLDRAAQLTDQAAALDPSRGDLWERHRAEITAKRLFHQARAANSEGDHSRADKLIEDARKIDPRMQMLWPRHLTGMHSDQQARQPPGPASARDNQNHGRPDHARPPTLENAAGLGTGPQPPDGPARGDRPTPGNPRPTRTADGWSGGPARPGEGDMQAAPAWADPGWRERRAGRQPAQREGRLEVRAAHPLRRAEVAAAGQGRAASHSGQSHRADVGQIVHPVALPTRELHPEPDTARAFPETLPPPPRQHLEPLTSAEPDYAPVQPSPPTPWEPFQRCGAREVEAGA